MCVSGEQANFISGTIKTGVKGLSAHGVRLGAKRIPFVISGGDDGAISLWETR